jgi:hypothetical protein
VLGAGMIAALLSAGVLGAGCNGRSHKQQGMDTMIQVG